ncbi:serine/threonine-protein kinase [Myxococcus landrumensis]|uniref:Protein kinase n=1 Tax=Myxococcus landrumensis TaxID=2813577 RepID=A0ABX7NIL0_9BACT|nr:serine/threonine-protein kinase [Myxococcus landrumus]QSQ18189.1 protein kinase [Myxococcus landrumus]
MARQVGASEDPDRGRRIGKYEILTRLSLGGMAELFLAFTSGPGGFRKFVAVKQILPDIKKDEQFVEMFLDEARITAAFSHANIGQVFDLGEEDGELYLAMEFLPGQNLEQVIKAAARRQYGLPLGFIGRVIRDTCLGLHYAHHFMDPSGRPVAVVHRDVSPKNVMLTYDGVVKVIDFGIAKARGRLGRTQVGTVKGTSGYMSPEQVRGHAMDGRSDLFSVGVMMHELLTGQRLFNGPHEAAVMLQIVEADVVSPRAGNSIIPEALDAVVMRALARDAGQRFATCREMARAIEAALGSELFDEDGVTEVMGELFAEKRQKTRTLLELASRAEDAQVSEAAGALQQEEVGEHVPTSQLPVPKTQHAPSGQPRTDGSSAPKPVPQRRPSTATEPELVTRAGTGSGPKPMPQRRPATATDPEIPTRAGSGPKQQPRKLQAELPASTPQRTPRPVPALEAGISRTPRPRPEEVEEEQDSLDEPSDLSTQQFRTRPPRPGAAGARGNARAPRGGQRSDTPVQTPAAKSGSKWMGRLFLLLVLGGVGWAATQPLVRAQFVPAFESVKAWVKAELDPPPAKDPAANAAWPPQQKPGPPPGFPGTTPAPDPRPAAQAPTAEPAPEVRTPPPETPVTKPASGTRGKDKETTGAKGTTDSGKGSTRGVRGKEPPKPKTDKEPVTTVTQDPNALAEVLDTSSAQGAAKAGMGWISLSTVPPAAVFDGSTQLGTTPLKKFPLPVGTYSLRLVDPTNAEAVDRRLSAPINPGKVTTIQIRLADLPLYKE